MRAFEADVFCRGGMARERQQRGLSLSDAAAAEFPAEQCLGAGIVVPRVEAESTLLVFYGIIVESRASQHTDPPTCQDMRERNNVRLRVTAVHPERMEFHDLARVVLV